MTDTENTIKVGDTGKADGRAVKVVQTAAGGVLVETTDHTTKDGKPVAGKPFRATWISRDDFEPSAS